MKRVIKTMTPEMKELLRKKQEAQKVRELLHPGKFSRKKFHAPDKTPVILPEDFTGRDLKTAKRLMKELERRQRRENRKRNAPNHD